MQTVFAKGHKLPSQRGVNFVRCTLKSRDRATELPLSIIKRSCRGPSRPLRAIRRHRHRPGPSGLTYIGGAIYPKACRVIQVNAVKNTSAVMAMVDAAVTAHMRMAVSYICSLPKKRVWRVDRRLALKSF